MQIKYCEQEGKLLTIICEIFIIMSMSMFSKWLASIFYQFQMSKWSQYWKFWKVS